MAKLSCDESLTAAVLAGYLSYESQTGHLTWLKRLGRGCIGAVAGSKARNGYVRIKLFGRDYSAHRLAWLMHYGAWPEQPIDHINGDKADNRIANLRLASVAQNAWNMKAKRGAASQYRGVCFIAHLNKWRAQLTANKQTYPLGYFSDERDAARAYDRKAKDLYGAFARFNFPDQLSPARPKQNSATRPITKRVGQFNEA
jgi:hypothetical protein